MGRRAEIAEQQVFEAGRDMAASGIVVTGWGLRRWVGGGKPERLMAVWRAAQGEAVPEEQAGGLLPAHEVEGMRDGLRAALGHIDRLEAAGRQVVVEAEARALRIIDDTTRDASAAVQTLEAELERASERVGDVLRKYVPFEAEAANERAAADILRNEVKAAREEVAGLRQQVEAERAVAAELRMEVKAAREAGAALQQEAANLKANLAVAEERLRAAQERTGQVEERERAALALRQE